VSLEPLLAVEAAKMKSFTVVSDFELGCLFVQDHSANWVFRHYSALNLTRSYVFYLLSLVVKMRMKVKERKKEVF